MGLEFPCRDNNAEHSVEPKTDEAGGSIDDNFASISFTVVNGVCEWDWGSWALDRLCLRWLFTRWPAARADINDNSPANTVAHTIWASCLAFSPGVSELLPLHPSICKHADWALNIVPPPTVPTSIQGIVQVIYKSPLPLISISVEHILLQTFWAASYWNKSWK